MSGSVAQVPPVDQCAWAAEFEIGPTIVDFEPWVDQNGNPQTRAHCDTADTDICIADPFFFNHDSNTILNAGDPPTCDPNPDVIESRCSYCPPPLDEFTSTPQVGSTLPSTVIPEGPRCGTSTSALRFTARNIGTCYGQNGRPGWGGNLEIKLNFDATGYDGIGLWVRKGGGPSGATILVSVVDEATLGIAQATAMPGEDHCGCFPPASSTEKPVCSTDPDKDFTSFPDSLKCDPFGAAITLTDDWSFLPVYFSKLRQKGFGKAAPLGRIDQSQLTRLQFLVTAGDWDFWLDDVTLFRSPP